MTCRAARAIVCAVGSGVFGWSATAAAEEASDTPGMERRRDEHVRVDLGIGLMGGLGGGIAGAGGAHAGLGGLGSGGLGGLGLIPTASVAFEGHLAGPAWLVVEGSGGYADWNGGDGTSASSVSGALRAGPRFEWRVVDRVDAGFHVLARAATSHAENEPGSEWDAFDVGGDAGASIHFRATPVFGVRLVLDVVSAGYSTASTDELAATSSGYAEVDPSPAVQLTLTL